MCRFLRGRQDDSREFGELNPVRQGRKVKKRRSLLREKEILHSYAHRVCRYVVLREKPTSAIRDYFKKNDPFLSLSC